MYNGNIRQNPLFAASCVTKNRPVSPRFSPVFLSHCKFSILIPFFVQQNPIYAVFRVRIESLAEHECISTCTKKMNSKTLNAQHPVVLKDPPIIASFPPTVYFGMPSSALLQLCTAECSMRRTLYSKIFSSRT